MTDKVKVLIYEQNGTDLEDACEYPLDADGLYFDPSTSNLTSDNVQDAITETLESAAGFPRAGLALVQNGISSNNDLISYSHLTPNTPIVFPVNTQLNELTFSNDRTSVECDLEIWDGGVDTGTLVKTINVTSGADNYEAFDLNADLLTFNAGEIIQIKYIDQGTNARDMVVTLWISRIP